MLFFQLTVGKSYIESLLQSPFFKIDGTPILEISAEQHAFLNTTVLKMIEEQDSSYPYKDELIHNYIQLIVHESVKMQPSANIDNQMNAASRITSVFLELLERQFPIEEPHRPLQLQYTFALSDKVSRQKVSFKNRYGILFVGDMYTPKVDAGTQLPAIVVSGPFGAVKEQSSGLYAMQMAERRFASLAFDPSYTGESGGEPRNQASPDINSEDFSAAGDFLGLQKGGGRNRIGIIGICGFRGMALNATAVDKRIKAVATTSMYNMSRVMSKGYYDKMTLEQLTQMLEQISQQRWKDAESGTPVPGPRGLPIKLDGNEPQFVKEYFDYYRTNRGFHPRSINSNGSWLVTSAFPFMNFPLMTFISEISP